MTIKTQFMSEAYFNLRRAKLKQMKSKCEICAKADNVDYPLLINLKTVLDKPFNHYGVNEVDLVCRDCIQANNTLDMPQEGWEFLCGIDGGDRSAYRCEHIKTNGKPCNISIRYQQILYHPDVGVKVVGRDCTKNIATFSEGSCDVFDALQTNAYKNIEANLVKAHNKEKYSWVKTVSKSGKPCIRYQHSFGNGKLNRHYIDITITQHNNSHFLKVWLSGFGEVHFKNKTNSKTAAPFLWNDEETLFRIATLIIEYRKRTMKNKNTSGKGFKEILLYELNKLGVRMVKGENN